MPTTIQNPSTEPCALPFPFAGVLRGRQIVCIDVPIATVVAALGGAAASDALLVAESSSVGPYDTAYQGSVGGTLAVTTLTASTTITAAGDISASGGFRKEVGPFTAPGAAGVIAAAQANLDLRYSFGVTALATGFVAKRAGSIMGLSAQLSAAITGAGESAAVKATINGLEVGAALDLAFTQAGAEVKDYAVAAKDAVPFVAGDVIGVSYTSTAGVTNTPALVASLEIEC